LGKSFAVCPCRLTARRVLIAVQSLSALEQGCELRFTVRKP